MKFTHVEDKNKYIINIEQGEEVVGTLTQFCKEHAITNGMFTGIGAARGLSCGYYELDEKKYYFTAYDELVEVVSLQGNVMLKNGEPFVHVHGVFTDTKNVAFGGHIEKVTAGIVIEVMFEVLSSKVERKLDEKIGLYLLSCEV